ncbi:DinB family protein [Radiobacillus kanasensis]|uniref:DinB family protein n=1 Tax=Radiobacillus kanasensis TaxID=2844358 RepID=UPI001E4B0ACD|nr:DinB family protein [Radiobacillus kanasensis]UFU00813.1 DinB family protein [Radiobacillus kanasensis]
MTVLEKYAKLIPFLEELKDWKNEDFFKPLSEGKWSVAAIVSHFMYWDRYVLGERLALMVQGKELPKSNISETAYNKEAEQYAHSGITKKQLIEEVIETRESLLAQLEGKDLTVTFTVGSSEMTVSEYFEDMVGHDEHHVSQIKSIIAK